MDKILRKIEKLNAKAQGASTEAEASAFAAKVQELLDKHNLEMRDLEKANVDFEITEEHYLQSHDFPMWKQWVAIATAELYFCKLMTTTSSSLQHNRLKRKVKLIFVGKEHNAKIAKSMTEYFFNSIDSMAQRAYPGEKHRRHFAHGCGVRLTKRIHEKTNQRKDTTPINAGRLPMVVQQELALIDDYLEKQGIKTKEYMLDKENSLIAGHGYQKGNEISLDEQIYGSQTKKKQIE